MDRSIILATDVQADPARVFEVLSTTRGQQVSGPPTARYLAATRGSASRRPRSICWPT